MNAIILMLFAAAEPTGLQAAFESAETVDVTYSSTGFTVTLVNPETIKNFAPLVEVRGEGIKSPGKPATPDIIRVTIRGKKTTEFWMIKNKLRVGDMMFTPADDRLWAALRGYFPDTKPLGQPPESPKREGLVQKTLTDAMKGADKLDVTFRKVTIEWPVGIGDGIRNVHLSNLKLAGDVIPNAKEPDDAVQVVFVNKETRIPIFLVGDTAYWGNDKHWWSVKLTRDAMWKQVVRTTPMPADVGIKSDPGDASGLAAAIESADSIVATRLGGETESLRGSLTLKREDIKGLSKFALGVGEPVSYYGKDDPDAIDIVVKKGKESRKYRLIGDTLVFDKDRSVKLEHPRIWMLIVYKLQKTDK